MPQVEQDNISHEFIDPSLLPRSQHLLGSFNARAFFHPSNRKSNSPEYHTSIRRYRCSHRRDFGLISRLQLNASFVRWRCPQSVSIKRDGVNEKVFLASVATPRDDRASDRVHSFAGLSVHILTQVQTWRKLHVSIYTRKNPLRLSSLTSLFSSQSTPKVIYQVSPLYT